MFHPHGTYRERARVGFYECDPAMRQRPACLVRRLQELGEKQLGELGCGYQTVLERHSQVFLLSQLILRIYRLPAEGEELELSTCPMGSKGARLYREALAEAADGTPLVRLYTSWSLFDPAARQILRPSAFPYALESGTLGVEHSAFRFRVPQGIEIARRPVRYSDLDANGHMNNAVYLDVICDALPSQRLLEQTPTEISIYYQHEAPGGSCMILYRGGETENEYTLYGEIEGQRCFEARVVFGGAPPLTEE